MASTASSSASSRTVDLTGESPVPSFIDNVDMDSDIIPTDGDDNYSVYSMETPYYDPPSGAATNIKEPKLSFSRLIKGLERSYNNVMEVFSEDKGRANSLTAAIRRTMKKAINAQFDSSSDVKPANLKHEVEEEIQTIHDRHSAAATIVEVAEEARELHFGQYFGNTKVAYNADKEVARELARIKRQNKPRRGGPAQKTSAQKQKKKRSAPREAASSVSRPMTRAAAAAAAATPPPPPATTTALASVPVPAAPAASPGPAVVAAPAEAAPAGNKRKRGGEGDVSPRTKRAKTALPAGVYSFGDIPPVGILFNMTTAEVFMAGVEYAVSNGAGASTEVNDRMRAFVREKLGETLDSI